jgi:DNA (cytosine-5)-methyltransferase 1
MRDVRRESKKNLFKVVSTFGGGGGSSLGYSLGGGKVLLNIDFVEEAIETYKANFPDTGTDCIDLRKVTNAGGAVRVLKYFKKHGVKKGELDILDGSPPCATFSRASLQGSNKIDKKGVSYSDVTADRIGFLIHDFVYLINCLQPKTFVFENVPDIERSNVFLDALQRLSKDDWVIKYKKMSSSHYGVAQDRRRLITIGIRPDIADAVGINEDNFEEIYPEPSSYQPTLRECLKGMKQDDTERKNLILNARRSGDYEIIRAIPKNPKKPTRLNNVRPDWTSDFNSDRLSWDAPSRTITQLGAQTGRGGPYHPEEDRLLTIPELKRIMAVPDDFILTGTRNQRAERLGRMVTPSLYQHLSKSLYDRVLSR